MELSKQDKIDFILKIIKEEQKSIFLRKNYQVLFRRMLKISPSNIKVKDIPQMLQTLNDQQIEQLYVIYNYIPPKKIRRAVLFFLIALSGYLILSGLNNLLSFEFPVF